MTGARTNSRSRSRSPGPRYRDREDNRRTGAGWRRNNSRGYGGGGAGRRGDNHLAGGNYPKRRFNRKGYDGGGEGSGHGPWDGARRRGGGGGTSRPVLTEEEERERTMAGPMMNFKQFVMTKPDHCTQKQLFDDYEVYVEQYREHHAKLFFANHNSKAFMRELYHPNLVRRQYSLRKDRAKSTAQLFMQKLRRGFFATLSLDVDFPGLRQFIEDSPDGSPLLWNEWPSQHIVEVRPSSVIELEDDMADSTCGEEQLKPSRGSGMQDHHPAYLLLPPAGCLMICDVDPAISKFDIYDELSKKGAIYVGMAEGATPVEARTAFVLFPDEATRQAAKESIPDMTIKVTKPIITIANNGDEQETLKVITLTLREPPVPPSCDVSVTPPAACTPQRIRRDLEFSRNLIMFLDEQLGVWEGEDEHPFLSSLADDMDEVRRLDLQIIYLRHVHSLCYYSGEICKDAVELTARCGGAFLRPQIPSSLQHYIQSVAGEEEESEEESEESCRLGAEGEKSRERKQRNSNANGNAEASGEQESNAAGEASSLEHENGEKRRLVSKSQRRWIKQLDARLEGLLRTAKQFSALVPAAIDEETPHIKLKWTAFCQEKVFEDDEHKHRCRLCNKPFKAPVFVFKHLRKKHEEELNLIIDKYASIIMRDLYLKDPNKPIVLPRESSKTSVLEETYGRDYASSPWPGAVTAPNPAVSTAGPAGLPTSVSVAGPYGMVMVPAAHIGSSGAAMYALSTPGGPGHPAGVVMPPPPPPGYYAVGPAGVPSAAVYGTVGTAGNQANSRPDWDAPEPVPTASPFGSQGMTGSSRALASYDDL